MILYGLISFQSQDVAEWFLSREEAEAALRDVLADEPDFEGTVAIGRFDFGARDGVEVELLPVGGA